MKEFHFFLIFCFSLNVLQANHRDAHLPLRQGPAFEENKGQVKGFDGADHPEVKFMFQKGNLKIFLLSTGIAYQFERSKRVELENSSRIVEPSKSLDSLNSIETYRMDLNLLGANPNAKIVTEGKSEDYSNFYNHSALNVHLYNKVIYKNIYRGIDWVIYLDDNQKLKYDFILHPNSDYRAIKLVYKDAEQIYQDSKGNIIIRNRFGDIIENKPVSILAGKKIESEFVLKDNIIQFKIEKFNKTKMLVIDPKIDWSTYYGGSISDIVSSIDIDNNGNIYATGTTTSSSNIAYNGFQNNYVSGTGLSVFILKLNKNGGRIWSTYYGPYTSEPHLKLSKNKSKFYLSGQTSNRASNLNYNGYQTNYGGGTNDAFLACFDSSGTRVWATYIGGSGVDIVNDVVVDSSNEVYILGQTSSDSNIALNGFQDSLFKKVSTDQNNFIIKYDTSGQKKWGTYYGIAVGSVSRGFLGQIDSYNKLHVLTQIRDTNFFPYLNANDTCWSNTQNKLVFLKLDNSGNRLECLCKKSNNLVLLRDFKLDKNKNKYLLAYTSIDGWGYNGFKNNISSSSIDDALLLKFDSSLNLAWGTYFGGTNSEVASKLSLDNKNHIYLSGYTNSTSGIAYRGWMNSASSPNDGFVVKFKSTGGVIWSSYWGSNGGDLIYDVSAHQDKIVIAGWTTSTSGISSSGFQNSYGGGANDGFIVSISCNRDTILYDTICRGDTLIFNGIPRTQAGDYLDTLETWDICDSFITMKLTVSRRDTTHLYDTICQGTSRTWTGNQLTTSGVYLDTMINAERCDSFLVYHLTVRPLDTTYLYDTSCGNTPRVWNGMNLTALGTYLDTLSNQYGCDSFLFYHYIPKPIHHSTDTAKICRGTIYHGHTTSGTYSDTLRSAFGCDSVVSLYLTVLDTSSIAWTASICSGSYYLFQGDTLRSAGHYRDTLKNRNGCDSFLILTLLLKSSASKIIFDTLCPEKTYKFGTKILSKSGIYRDSLKAKNGCDSIVTLNLFVRPKQQLTLIDTNYRLIATSGFSQYRWSRNGQLLAVPNLNLCPAITSGIYKVEVTEKNGCRYFSDSMVIERSSIATMTDGDLFDVFPNPTREHLYIQIGSHLDEEFSITIYTIEGKKINAPLHRITSSLYSISTTGLSSGDYLIELKTGKKIVTKKWMVE